MVISSDAIRAEGNYSDDNSVIKHLFMRMQSYKGDLLRNVNTYLAWTDHFCALYLDFLGGLPRKAIKLHYSLWLAL